jgi:hypothetical protein
MDVEPNAELLRALQQDRVEFGAGYVQGPPCAVGIGAEACKRPPPVNYSCASRRSYRALLEYLVENSQIPKQHFDAGMKAFARPNPGGVKSFDKMDAQASSCRPNGRSTTGWTGSNDNQVERRAHAI